MIVRYVINTLTAGVDPGAYELAARVLLPGRQDPALNHREVNRLAAVAVIVVQLAEQLRARRRAEVLLVLREIANLDALDVAPVRSGGALAMAPDANVW